MESETYDGCAKYLRLELLTSTYILYANGQFMVADRIMCVFVFVKKISPQSASLIGGSCL